jgi:hypothetical protein
MNTVDSAHTPEEGDAESHAQVIAAHQQHIEAHDPPPQPRVLRGHGAC